MSELFPRSFPQLEAHSWPRVALVSLKALLFVAAIPFALDVFLRISE
jgi:hypothetical protein